MKRRSCVIAALGIALLLCGFYLLKSAEKPDGFLIPLPYLCIGFGCGLFGHGTGNLIASRAIGRDPSAQKQMEIEKNDERNVAICNRAKSKAYDIMTFVFGALMVSFALMSVEPAIVLLLVFSYLFVQGCAIDYRVKYEKEI